MDLASIPDAVLNLHDAIREGVEPAEAVAETCAEFDVTENALRVRFEKQYDATPEAFAERKYSVVDAALLARQYAEERGLHPADMKHAGKRFVLEVKDEETGEVWRRPYRFIRFCGKLVDALDEETNERGEIWDRELLEQIAAQTGWRYRI